jgi:hypothetical protein
MDILSINGIKKKLQQQLVNIQGHFRLYDHLMRVMQENVDRLHQLRSEQLQFE